METSLPDDLNSIQLPINVVFKPEQNGTELETFNISQFKGVPPNVSFEGSPIKVNVGDVFTVVSNGTQPIGINHWVTADGLIIPKESSLFKITDDKEHVTDEPPVVEDKSTDEEPDKYYLTRVGYPLLGAIVGAFSAYKLSVCSNSKNAKLIGFIGACIGAGAGYKISKIDFSFSKG